MFDKSARLYDAIYSFKDYAAEAAHVHELIQQRAPGATTLLDVACGTGKHLEHLRAHYDAEGLDLNADLLAIARERNPEMKLHEGDMVDFDLDEQFDAVTCLFSSIGYVETVERLGQAIATMARHLSDRGVLIVEPWLTPEVFDEDRMGDLICVEEPELKIARMNDSRIRGRLSVMTFHYLVATRQGISYFTEEHSPALFTHEEYVEAFRRAGLEVEHDPQGLMGRGLYIGARTRDDGAERGANVRDSR